MEVPDFMPAEDLTGGIQEMPNLNEDGVIRHIISGAHGHLMAIGFNPADHANKLVEECGITSASTIDKPMADLVYKIETLLWDHARTRAGDDPAKLLAVMCVLNLTAAGMLQSYANKRSMELSATFLCQHGMERGAFAGLCRQIADLEGHWPEFMRSAMHKFLKEGGEPK